MLATYPVAHQFSGVLGFSLQVHADGFFKPKVIKVLVNLVESGSQAETAGLALGDELIRVQDLSLPGTDTVFLKPHMEFLKDTPKKLVFRKPNGQTYEAILIKP